MAQMEEWEYDGAAYVQEEDIDKANKNDDDVLMGVSIPPLVSRGDEGIGSLFECLCDGGSDYDSDDGADDLPETNANSGDAIPHNHMITLMRHFYLEDGDQDLMTDLDWEELEELQMLYGSSPRETRKEKW